MRVSAQLFAFKLSVAMLVSSFTTLALLYTAHAAASDDLSKRAKRNVSFELDTIEGALSYEVEISRPTGKLVGRFPLKTPVFSGKLVPGVYRLRSRSTDSRGLAGEWSEYESFEVHALAPTLIQPKDQSIAIPELNQQILFRWEAGPGAVRYRLDLTSPTFGISEFTEATELKLWIPAGDYEVRISSLLADGAGGEKSQAHAKFTVEKDLPKNLFGQIDFVWQADPGAREYELEITGDAGIVVHRLRSNEWHAPSQAGQYRLRTRARKPDGTMTEWTAPATVEVLSQSPNVLSPLPEAQIDTKDAVDTRVDFQWTRSASASQYRLEIHQIDAVGKRIGETPVINETIAGVKYSAKLPVGRAYEWTLIPTDSQGGVIETGFVTGRMVLLGRELRAPKIDEPGTRFVNELRWRATDVSKTFDFSLQRWDATQKSWTKLVQKRKTTDESFSFPPQYPGGKYRLAVRSVEPLRKPSEFTVIEFPVHNGDRSPVATAAARRREFLIPPRGLYLHASYLVTNIAYAGEDAESNSSISFSALGGTGRLGLGYNPPRGPFGFFGVVDLSGMRISGRDFTFASAETHLQYRHTAGFFQYRYSGGLFYKELIGVNGVFGEPGASRVASIATAGPHAGFDLSYALNSEYGLQFNSRAYMSMMGLKTPNNSEIASTLSYQFGFLISRRLDAGSVGYVGYAYRADRAAYKSTPNDETSGSITSLAGPDSLQEIGLSGHYLNLIYEWGW